MFTNDNAILYRNFTVEIEKEFGKNFTISNKMMKEFVLNLIRDKSFTEDDIMKCLLFCFRDYTIDYDILVNTFNYLGYKLPYVFSAYALSERTRLHELALTVGSEVELINKLVLMYQIGKLKFAELEISCYLMGYSFDEEYILLSDEQRRSSLWVKDKNDHICQLNEIGTKLLKCCNGLIDINMEEFFAPSFLYTTSWDFIVDYMTQNDIPNSVLTKHGLGRKKKYKLNTEGIKTKIDAYRLIFILDMNATVANQFLTICGFCFSPLSKTDMFFLNYLNGMYRKVKTLDELTELSRGYCYEHFEYPEWL